MKNYKEKCEIIAEGNSYYVNIHSYRNGADQLRFRVSVNEGPVSIFGWDNHLDRFAVMADNRNPSISPTLEMIIARKLDRVPELKKAA